MKLAAICVLFVTVLVLVSASPAKQNSKSKENEPATVHYHLWFTEDFGGNDELTRQQQVATLRNTTFFEVMGIAATQHQDYVFESIEFPFGNYITSIGGVTEDRDNDIYWMIYQLEGTPDTDNPPGDELLTPVGVDAIRVEHNDIYLFWYKQVEFKQMIPRNH